MGFGGHGCQSKTLGDDDDDNEDNNNNDDDADDDDDDDDEDDESGLRSWFVHQKTLVSEAKSVNMRL